MIKLWVIQALVQLFNEILSCIKNTKENADFMDVKNINTAYGSTLWAKMQ